MIILVLLIVTALAFDFTNGFHDTGNAMATSIATGALKPKTAVLLAGILNLVGAFLSVEVAVTVTPASSAAFFGICSLGCSASRPAHRTRSSVV